uniref:Transposase Tc1-like domain-containing protein n=1 Tax=Anguilla anguilla TaxID=7936 RepID=A0A0E9XWV2_ANGAN
MGYSSRRPHRVPLLSAKNRKLRLQLARAQQNWTIEDWKNIVRCVYIYIHIYSSGLCAVL